MYDTTNSQWLFVAGGAGTNTYSPVPGVLVDPGDGSGGAAGSLYADDWRLVGSVAAFFSDPDGLDRAGDNEKHVDQFKAWGKEIGRAHV
jgi:hypothetical protein